MKLIAQGFIYLFLLIFQISFCQNSKITSAKKPDWVTIKHTDYNKTSLDKDAQDGYIDYAFEKQVSLATQTSYIRTVLKIITQAGVQNASQISVSFDPSFEKLVFHEIKIIRNGASINKLNLSKLETVRQETELDEFIYNGSLNAILILDDVRQGDIIEYSFSRIGFNPVFQNKYTDEYSLQIDYPVYEYYYKLIVPPGRNINYKILNDNTSPTITTVNGDKVYEWKKSNVAGMNMEDMVPQWYNPYSKILLSEFNSWAEVNQWSLGLFPLNFKPANGLLNKINEIKNKYSTNEQRASAALRFVQDDIRYMGVEMGENSHRPANPSKVFEQRFGDCKEKSYLLCMMLREMGIDATPVLINTGETQNLFNFLPSATAFNHVTVKANINGKDYWWDPTISFQRGSLVNISYPDYKAGLVLSDTTTALTTIPLKTISKVEITEYFKVKADMKGATLHVTTLYTGGDADETRNDFNNLSKTEQLEKYQKYYAAYFENIVADSITFIDNEVNGTIETNEYYHIPKIWKKLDEGGSQISIYPFVIDGFLRRPKDRERKMPISFYYPINHSEKIILEMPENWNVDEDKNDLDNKNFKFSNKFYVDGNKIILEARYNAIRPYAPANESEEYFENLEEYDKACAYSITYGANKTESKSKPKASNKESKSTKIILFMVVLAAFIGGIFIAKRQQRGY